MAGPWYLLPRTSWGLRGRQQAPVECGVERRGGTLYGRSSGGLCRPSGNVVYLMDLGPNRQ